MGNTLSAFLFISIALTAILLIAAPWLEQYIAPTASSDPSQQLSVYVRLLSFIVILYCFSGLLSASLECLENYIPSKLTSFFISLTSVLFAILFGRQYGTIVAAYGSLCGIGLHAVYAYIVLRKKRKIRIKLPKFDDSVKSILYLAFPMMLSVAITSINSLVDKVIAVRLGEGAVSALNYGSLLSRELVTGVLVVAISSIVASRFSENILHKEYDALNKNINLVLYALLLIVLPVTIFYFVYNNEIIGFVFERGAFDIKAKELTIAAFTGYIFGLLFLPFREIFIRVQYAYQDSKSPMVSSFITVVFNIILSIVLGFKLGIIGVSIATSIASLLNSYLCYYWIRKAGVFNINIDSRLFIKLFLNMALILCVARYFKVSFTTVPIMNLLIAFILIFASFFFLSYLSNKAFFTSMLELIRKKRM